MAETPTWAEVIRLAIDSRLSDVHVALPGRIESYDAATQTADIKPLIKRVIRRANGEPVEEELPVIPGTPVVFPGAGGFFLSFPVAVGDTGLVIFCERNLDRWRETGRDVNPGDQSCHPLSGATFHPGLRASSAKLAGADATNLAIGKDGGYVVHFAADSVEFPAGAANFLARADKVEAQLKKIADMFAGWTPVPNDGGAALKTLSTTMLVGVGSNGSTASATVKGD